MQQQQLQPRGVSYDESALSLAMRVNGDAEASLVDCAVHHASAQLAATRLVVSNVPSRPNIGQEAAAGAASSPRGSRYGPALASSPSRCQAVPLAGLTGLARGYEQYRESLNLLRPTTEFGEASSDDLSSEWETSDVENNNCASLSPDVAPTSSASRSGGASSLRAFSSSRASSSPPLAVSPGALRRLHQLALPPQPQLQQRLQEQQQQRGCQPKYRVSF